MARCSSLRLALFAACALGLAAPAYPQQKEPAAAEPAGKLDKAGVDTVKLEQTWQNRLTVPVRIDGEGPFPFVVDTGAERTVISGELARRLELGPGRPVRLHSMTGQDDVRTALIRRLDMSRKQVADIHAPVLRQAHIGASGILGIDTLQSQRIDFDFAERKMTITPSRATATLRRDDPGTIIVTARNRFGRLVLVDAELEGEKVIVVLDTGSDVTIGNEALRRRLERRKKLGKTMPVELISVTGGRLIADYTRIDRMRIGGMTVSQLPIGFVEVHPFAQLELKKRPALLLGMDALGLFSRVSVDFASRKVSFLLPDKAWLRPRDTSERFAARLGGQTELPAELR